MFAKFERWLTCVLNGHTWVAKTHADWEAGAGWYRKCTVCGKQKTLH